MNGYNLIRAWYNYKFENPHKVKAKHSDFYCYLVDQWNRLGQKNSFGLPTSYTMECLNIGSYNTYKSILNDLVDFGFVKIVKYSKNQHQSKMVALSNFDKALDRALDKATIKAVDEAPNKAVDTINKQLNNTTINKETIKQSFEIFWELYDKKVDRKKSFEKWEKLKQSERDEIIDKTPAYVKANPEDKFRKNPVTFFNNRSWEDEIIEKQKNNGSGSNNINTKKVYI